MSGLFSTLNSSATAITAHGRAIEISGRNLANVDNPAYARQRVVYGDRSPFTGADGVLQSSGLEAMAVQQLRDELQDRQVVRETSLKGMYDVQQSLLGRAEAQLGQGILRSQSAGGTDTASSVGGLAAALDNFFNSFQDLAARPTDAGSRQSLLQHAGALVGQLRTADGRIGQLESDLSATVNADVADANGLLQSIASLNARIARAEFGHPGSASDLRDERQARIEALAAKIAVEIRPGEDGQVTVVARDGGVADVVLVEGATVTGPLSFDGTDLTGGAGAAPLTVSSGSIRGALDVRADALRPLRSELDALARQLVVAVNAAYDPSGASTGFFAADGLSAASIALAPSLSASNLRAGNGAAGDNSVALAVAKLAARPFAVSAGDAIDGTMAEHYARAVSSLGQRVAAANSRADEQATVERYVRGQRDAASGVSLDEEMSDLVKYQRAFQASSRVFTIVDDLLDSVVNGLGR